jgi:hypothetical protein
MKAVKGIKTIPTFSIDIRKNQYNFFGCHSDLWEWHFGLNLKVLSSMRRCLNINRCWDNSNKNAYSLPHRNTSKDSHSYDHHLTNS